MAGSEKRGRTGTAPVPPVGALLRDWRQRRRYSQLALALDAEISARHLSFIETGRSTPSREMLLHLADHLQIPYRDRNALLVAAGYAPEYAARPFADPALAEVRRAMDLMLTNLEPCPALAVDRRWTLIASNRAVDRLLAGAAPALVQEPVNVLRLSLHPGGLAPQIVNLSQWCGYVLGRLRRDVALAGDAFLRALLDELQAYAAADGAGDAPADPEEGLPVVVPLHLRTDAGVLSFVSTTTVFGSALDVTVAELAIESFLPADERTARALRLLAAEATATP